jgi:tetratricopeptide (TPR) repeat protein
MLRRLLEARHALMIGILLATVFLAFGHSLWQDFAPIDDTLLVRENLAIRGLRWANIVYIFTHYDPEIYIPVTFLSFQINYVLGGLDPFGFHLGNLLIHGANAVLVGAIVSRLLGEKRKDNREKIIEKRLVPASLFSVLYSLFSSPGFIAALIFAVHPLHTEAVVWIAGRKDLLSTFFYLLTLITYLRHRDGMRGMYLLSILFAVLAMLSKAMAMTLPVTLVLMDWFESAAARPSFDRAQDDTRRRINIINKIPFILLSVLCAFVAIGGKARVVGSTSMLDTGLVAIRSTAHYLWQLFIPMGFSVFYQQRDPISLVSSQILFPLIILCTLLFLGWFFRKSKPWISFGVLFYFITLSPTFLNFHKGLIAFYAVDRYAYLPSIGVIFIAAIFLQKLLSKMHRAYKSQIILQPSSAQGGLRPAGNSQFLAPPKSAGADEGGSIFNFIPVVLLAAIFIPLSRHQTHVWDSPETLSRHAVTVDEASVPARATLAQVLRQMNRKAEAFEVLREGLQFGDDVSYHLEAGNIYAANGQVADAIEEFTKAAQMKPDLPEPLFSIGSLEDQRGNADLALEYYRKALALDTSYVAARSRIAGILIDRKEHAEAEEQLTEALRWNESSFIANFQMYRLRMAQGRESEAELYLERAKELRLGAEELRE